MNKARYSVLLFVVLSASLAAIAACKKSKSGPTNLASLTTLPAASITTNSVTLSGVINSDGRSPVTLRGMCWSTNPNPTIADSKAEAGSGTGTFTVNVAGLAPATTYNFRVFAQNAKGVSYGENLIFKTSAAFSTVPNFQICGSKIYDPQGKEFIIKGVNVGGPGWSWNETTVSQFDNLITKWGFNAIRVATKGAPSLDSYTNFNCRGTEFPQYEYTTFGTLREIIKKYTDAKVVVMIEWHKVGGMYSGTDLTCAANWWTSLATEYKDNPYVWFDMYNEPQLSSHDVLASAYQTVIESIRGTGNRNIIVATGNWWGQDANTWDAGNVPAANSFILSKSLLDPVKNILYSIHVYDQWMAGQSKLDNYLDRVIAQNKAIVVAEYGVYNNSDVSATVDFTLNAVQPRKIGRMAWAWGGGDRNDLIINANGTSGGGSTAIYDANGVPTNLTDFGTKVYQDLRRAETLGTKPATCP